MTNTRINQLFNQSSVPSAMLDSGGYLVTATYQGYSALFFNTDGAQSDSFDADGYFKYSTAGTGRVPSNLTEGEMLEAVDIY